PNASRSTLRDGRPIRRPSSLALRNPAFTRSTMRLRSSSAMALMITTIARLPYGRRPRQPLPDGRESGRAPGPGPGGDRVPVLDPDGDLARGPEAPLRPERPPPEGLPRPFPGPRRPLPGLGLPGDGPDQNHRPGQDRFCFCHPAGKGGIGPDQPQGNALLDLFGDDPKSR